MMHDEGSSFCAVAELIPLLLVRTADEKKFLRQVSSKAMTHLVTKYPSRALLAALYRSADHKHALVQQSVSTRRRPVTQHIG